MADTVMSTLYPVLWYFILYSFLGWCCEVVFCSVNTGKFVNRGFLNGPLCPIYGFGAVIIVTCLEGVQHNLLILFIASAVLCSLLELVAGFLLEKLFHTRWWDYSEQPFNIGGYVCLKFSLLWGLACIFLMRVIHPGLEAFVAGIPATLGWVLLCVFYLSLLVDLSLTVATVTKLNRDLREITRLSADMRKPSDALAKSLGNSAISVAGKIETKMAEMDVAGNFKEATQSAKEKFAETEAGQKLEDLLSRRTRMRDRLMTAFPKMKSTRHHESLKELRKRLQGTDEDKEQ